MISFAAQLRGELRKLANPTGILLLAIVVAFVWQDVARTTTLASDQPSGAVVSQFARELRVREVCAHSPGVVCEQARGDVVRNQYFVQNSLELGRIGRSLGTLPGLVTFVAHQFTAGMGWLFVALLAALHVTGEESRGTVAASVLAAGRLRYWVGKAVSVLVASVVGLVIAVAVLYALRSTYAISPSVPSAVKAAGSGKLRMVGVHDLAPDPTWSSWSHAFGAFWHALAVLAVVAALFCTIALWFRRTTRAAVVGSAVVVGFFALAQWAHLGVAGPQGGLSRLLGLDRVPYGVIDVRLWDTTGRPTGIIDRPFGAPVLAHPSGTGQPAPDPYLGLVVWGLIVAAVVIVLIRKYRTRSFAE